MSHRIISLIPRLLAIVVAIAISIEAQSATTTVILSETSELPSVILVEGEFQLGDENEFKQIALAQRRSIVVLSSPGGNLIAGLEIGKAVRLKEFDTAVMDGVTCASACGLAWLGGTTRYMGRGASVGFHAAYRQESGQTQESGVANALVGAYLSQLGFPSRAIAYVTSAAPESMQWLSLSDAREVGILVAELNPSIISASQLATPATPVEPAEFLFASGVDLFGADLPGMPMRKMSLMSCQSACLSNGTCKAFTFNEKSSTCFLKDDARLAVYYASATSAFSRELKNRIPHPKLTILQRTDIVGSDFAKLDDSSLGRCIEVCDGNSRCQAFTFVAKRGQCWLKDAVGKTVKSRGMVSGLK